MSWEVYWESLTTAYMLEYDCECIISRSNASAGSMIYTGRPREPSHFHRDHPSLDPVDAGICLALAFTAPLKTLHITGARSKHAGDFSLPETSGAWADLAFHSSKPNQDFDKYGKDEESIFPSGSCQSVSTLCPGDVRAIPLDMLLKDVRHARFQVRAAAAKGLSMTRRYREFEQLLRDPDPRLRRAALDGINDYHAWFLEPARRKSCAQAG